MTDEPDDTPGRRPPTIELKATEIENPAAGEADASGAPASEPVAPDTTADPEAAAEPAPEQKEPGTSAGKASSGRPASGGLMSGSLMSRGLMAAMGVIAVAAAGGAGLWYGGFLPVHDSPSSPPSVETSSAASPAPPDAAAAPPAPAPVMSADITERLDKIERTIEAQKPDTSLGNRLTAAEAQNKSLADSLATLARQADDIAAIGRGAAKQADAAMSAANAAKTADRNGVQRADLDALTARIAALETAVKALAGKAAQQVSGADDKAARLTIAAEALRAAVERGAPYEAELAAVQSLGTDKDATAPLEPFAATGVPNSQLLGGELAGLVPPLEAASGTASPDTTFLGKLEANARRLVRITPVNAPPGDDPSAVITRITIDAERANIVAALADIAALPDAAKPVVADWLKKARARESTLAASRQIAASALADLSKPAVP